MTGKLFGIDVTVSFWFFAVLIFFVLAGRELFVPYLLLPIAVHELGHLLVMLTQGGLKSIALMPFSVEMKPNREYYGFWEEILLHSAGIAANLMFAAVLYLFFFQSMRIRLLLSVNLAVALFNLLPVGDLDGGRLMRLCAHRWLSPDTAYTVSRIASFLALTPLFAAAILLVIGQIKNFTLLIVCVYLTLSVIFRDYN